MPAGRYVTKPLERALRIVTHLGSDGQGGPTTTVHERRVPQLQREQNGTCGSQ